MDEIAKMDTLTKLRVELCEQRALVIFLTYENERLHELVKYADQLLKAEYRRSGQL